MSTQVSPFKFLDSYQENDAAIFFGRETETQDLYQALTGVKLLLVYGPSGAGKTSLIECGLRNQFSDADWFALTIRRSTNLIASVFEGINAQLHHKIELAPSNHLPVQESVDFGHAVETLFAERFQPVYLLFDQFEELLISGEEEEKKQFFTQLNLLIRHKVPCRVILIMREEFIGYLSEFEAICPSIFQHRFRLETMRRDDVLKVIEQTLEAEAYQPYFKVKDVHQLATDILPKLPDSRREIELAHVQVFLSELWDRAYQQKTPGQLPVMESDLVRENDRLKGILDNFLKHQLRELAQRYGEKAPLELLAAMISERFTKLQVAEPALVEDLTLKGVQLNFPLLELLQELVRRRIIRTLKSGETIQYEISHDVLAQVVGQNLTDEMKLRDKAQDVYALYMERKGVFNPEDLDYLRPFKDYLDYPTELQQRIVENEARLKAEEQAEKAADAAKLAEAEEQVKREQSLRETAELERQNAIQAKSIAQQAERSALRNLRIAIGVAALFLIATLSTIYLYKFSIQAKVEKVESLIRDADALILNLQYDAVCEKLREAQMLGVAKHRLAKAMLEPAYWYAESRQFSRAAELLKVAAQLGNRPRISKLLAQLPSLDPAEQLHQLRNCIISFDDSLSFRHLRKRYYPTMIVVKGGEYDMGDVMYDKVNEDEKVHRVTVSNFELAATEITIWQWSVYWADRRKSMNDFLSDWEEPGDYPVNNVNWYQAVDYVNWLNVRSQYKSAIVEDEKKGYLLNLATEGYRLPTEAEWEFAARAGGRKVRFGNGKDIANPNEINFYRSEVAKDSSSIFGKSRRKPLPGGSLKCPNALGFHDMSGNLWEWCWDWYDEEYYSKKSAYNNPIGPKVGSGRVLRSGSWGNFAKYCRVANRNGYDPHTFSDYVGFRLARTSNP